MCGRRKAGTAAACAGRPAWLGWPGGATPVPGPPGLKRALDEIPPASWVVVMGAGIVFAAGVCLVLGVRLAYRRDRFVHEASSPAAFTGVARTAMLGTRFALQDYHAVAAALLALSGVWWALLIVPCYGTGRPRRSGCPLS